jgi:hypothetical protein
MLLLPVFTSNIAVEFNWNECADQGNASFGSFQIPVGDVHQV